MQNKDKKMELQRTSDGMFDTEASKLVSKK